MSRGILKQNGVHLEPHEWKTIKLFLEQGKNIELIPRSRTKGLHIGDFTMDGVLWEAKAPVGNGKKNVENILQTATTQSRNIIIDLRRSKMQEDIAIKAFQKEFHACKGIKRLKIITKDEHILDFNR